MLLLKWKTFITKIYRFTLYLCSGLWSYKIYHCLKIKVLKHDSVWHDSCLPNCFIIRSNKALYLCVGRRWAGLFVHSQDVVKMVYNYKLWFIMVCNYNITSFICRETLMYCVHTRKKATTKTKHQTTTKTQHERSLKLLNNIVKNCKFWRLMTIPSTSFTSTLQQSKSHYSVFMLE